MHRCRKETSLYTPTTGFIGWILADDPLATWAALHPRRSAG
jgi:hypothetical protein